MPMSLVRDRHVYDSRHRIQNSAAQPPHRKGKGPPFMEIVQRLGHIIRGDNVDDRGGL